MAGACRYKIVPENPNDAIGGGGCACSPTKHEDAEGPYAVFYASETDNNLSPHLVLCAPCAGDAGIKLGTARPKARKRSN